MQTTYLRLFAHIFVGVALITFTCPSLAAEPERVVFLHYWTGAMGGGIDDMVKAFNKAHPQYRVEATGFEHESFKVSVPVMLSGGNPPDLFSYWAGAKVQALVNAGQILPIDDLWQKAGLGERFSLAVAKACTYDGEKYVVPVTQHYVCFFYNTKLFMENGLNPPETWEDFLAACRTLQAAGVTPLALGVRDKWPAQFWFDYLLLRTAGPGYRARLMAGKASYEDPEVKQTLGLWKELIDAGFYNKTPRAYDWSEAAKMVANGRAAMTLMGTWIIGLYDGQLGLKQGRDYGVFSFPVVSGDVPATALGPIDVIVLPKGGKTEAAKKTLAYFTEIGPQEEMSRGSGALAPNKDVPADFYSPLQREVLEEIRNIPNWAFNYDLATPPCVAKVGLEAFGKFIEHPGDAEAIMAELERRAEDALSEKRCDR